MRRLMKMAAVALLCTMMCGCLEATPLTDAEMDIVAEYAAELLLKYDKNYRSPLLPEEELAGVEPEEAVTPAPEPTLSPEPTQSAEEPGVTPLPGNAEETTTRLTDVASVEGIEVSCNSFEIRREVVRNEYFFLESKEGKEYLILNFKLENTTDKPIVFDASEQKLECSLDINSGTMYKLSVSMLENDLQYMPIEVPAQKSVDAVLVFEITSTLKEPIETAQFVIKNKANDSVFVKLK